MTNYYNRFLKDLPDDEDQEWRTSRAPNRTTVSHGYGDEQDQAKLTKELVYQRRRMAALLNDSLTPKQRANRMRRR